MCPIFFIHSSTGGHLGGFHVLAIVNNATVNMEYGYFFKMLTSFPLAIHPEVELLDRKEVLFLIF